MLGREYVYVNHRSIEKSDLEAFSEYAAKKGLNSKILN
jgi:hypothetical protein